MSTHFFQTPQPSKRPNYFGRKMGVRNQFIVNNNISLVESVTQVISRTDTGTKYYGCNSGILKLSKYNDNIPIQHNSYGIITTTTPNKDFTKVYLVCSFELTRVPSTSLGDTQGIEVYNRTSGNFTCQSPNGVHPGTSHKTSKIFTYPDSASTKFECTVYADSLKNVKKTYILKPAFEFNNTELVIDMRYCYFVYE